MSGVLVNHVEAVCDATGKLHKDDVLVSLDGTLIADDGTVPFRKRERIFFDYLLTGKYLGYLCISFSFVYCEILEILEILSIYIY